MKSMYQSLTRFVCYCTIIFLISACSNYQLLPVLKPAMPDFNTDNGVLTATQAASTITDYQPLLVTDEMQDYFDPYLSGAMTQRQRAYMLNSVLRGSAFLSIEYDLKDTLTAEQAFNKQSANCVGFANLYIALARHYGLKSNYQLIRKFPEWNRQEGGNEQVMSISIHINSLVTLSSGHQLVVDLVPRSSRQVGVSEVISDKSAEALFYNNLAIDEFSRGNYEKAYRLIAKAMNYDDDLDLLWVNLGAIFRHNNQLTNAETAYRVALAINPDSYTAMNNLAVLYQMQEDWIQFEAYLKKTEKYRLRNPYYHFQLARLAEQEQDYAGAIDHMRKAIRLKDDEPEFQEALSMLYRLSSTSNTLKDKKDKSLLDSVSVINSKSQDNLAKRSDKTW